MKTEDKKYLAEFMGWEISNPGLVGGTYIEMDDGPLPIEHWNPDSNHDQFKEVWNKLDETDQMYVLLGIDESGQGTNDTVSISLNDLPRVMEAVLEVIREQ